MIAKELFQKTLEEYKRQLRSGYFQSLSAFCRERHVNARAMTHWLNDQGIHLIELRKELLPESIGELSTMPEHPMFSKIDMPASPTILGTTGLQDIRIESDQGLRISIGSCQVDSLVFLLSHLSSSHSCSL